MLILENVPRHVTRLAVALTLYEANITEILRGSRESNELFAAECGLSMNEYLAAADWLRRFYAKYRPAILGPTGEEPLTEIHEFGTSH
jgi:hypothetical protein